ncbi:MAG: hypothetical protein AABW79_04280 [Nanoarchaeota archaeon]
MERGEKFRGLIDKVLGDNDFAKLEPQKAKIYRPGDDQLALWNMFGNDVSSSHIGLFFELLSTGIYGGNLVDSVSPFLSSDSFISSFPRVDIVDVPGKVARECKGCSYAKEMILRDEQVGNYDSCQLRHPDYRLIFEIYKHRLKNIRSFKGPERELHKSLAGNLGYSLRLDYLLLKDLTSRALEQKAEYNGRKLVTRAEASSYRNSSRLTPSFLNGLFEEPEKIVDCIGLDVGDLTIRREITSKEVRVYSLPELEIARLNGTARGYVSRVSSLPIVSICYKDHDLARSKFLEGMLSSEGSSDRLEVEESVKGTLYEEAPF